MCFFFICDPRLCTLDGRPVCGPTELENNQYYVAVGAEKFKALPYDHCDPCRDVIRENNTIEGYDTYDLWSKFVTTYFEYTLDPYFDVRKCVSILVSLFSPAAKTSCLLLERQDIQRTW